MVNPYYYHEQGGYKHKLSEESKVAIGNFMKKNRVPSRAWILGRDFVFRLECGADSYFSFVCLYEFNEENTSECGLEELQKALMLSRYDTVIVTTKLRDEVLRDFGIRGVGGERNENYRHMLG